MTPGAAGLLDASRRALAGLLLVQAALAAGHLAAPGWRLLDLDREHNLPTWFHSGLLAVVAVLALELVRAEGRFLARIARRRAWAAVWLAVAAGFAYLAADEALVIHEGFLNAWIRARLAPASPLQLTLAWLLVFLPAIVLAVAFLLAALGARARLCPPLAGWGGAGLGLWVLALTLEATTKSFFIPRNLYWLEVVLEESAESLGTTCFAWGLWRYRRMLAPEGPTAATPAFRVPWGWVLVGTLALAVPAGVVGLSIARNPHALHRYVGDDHLRAGRLEEAVRAYQAALAGAPTYGRAWYRLGVAELRRGNLAAAEEAFATALRLEPRRAAAAKDLGVALFRQGRHGEALEAFQRAAALDPDDPGTARNLALALRRLGREAEAQGVLARARAGRPGGLRVTAQRVTVPARFSLAYIADRRLQAALVESRHGRVEGAVAAFRHVLAAAPHLAPAHLGLGNELVRWRLAVSLGKPTEPGAGEAREARSRRTAALFSDWLLEEGGTWRALDVLVEGRPSGDAGALAREARHHLERARALGAGAPAHVGLAALARLDGDLAAAGRHLALAQAADPSLPPTALSDVAAAGPR